MARTWKAWTNKEIERLREKYPIQDRYQLEREFPNRKWSAIVTMASQLKLTKKPIRSAADWLAICAAHKPTFIFEARSDSPA